MPDPANPRWITAAEVAENYQPKNGGGGIGGTIADKQVAFGNGTDIAGSNLLKWDNSLFTLTLTEAEDIPAASIGNFRVYNGFDFWARNENNDGDIPLLNFGDGKQIIIGDNTTGCIKTRNGGGHELQIQSADDGGLSISAPTNNILLDANTGSVNLVAATEISLFSPATFYDILKLTPMAAPGSPVEGMIYAGTDHHLHYYNGTDWTQIDFGFQTGWTANADAGDKMKSVQSAAQIDPIAAALDASVTGAGNLLKNVAEKVKALETALRAITLPHA